MQSFHSYFSSEHSRLLMLWRQVVGFRRNICELKNGTERSGSVLRELSGCAFPPCCAYAFLLSVGRDLSDMRNELARASHSVQMSCSSLSSALHSREGGAALTLERERSLRLQLEQQLRERVGEMMNLQTKTDAERTGLNLRSVEVSRWVGRSSVANCCCVNLQVV